MDNIHVATAFVRIAHMLKEYKTMQQEVIVRRIYTQLINLLELQINKMGHQAHANCLWSIGKLIDIFGYRLIQESQLQNVIDKLHERQVLVIKSMTSQEISNSLWAMAKIELFPWQNVQMLVRAALNLADYKPQHVSNMLWALATLGYKDTKILAHLLDSAKIHIDQMLPQHLANVMWSLQQYRYYDKQFLDMIEKLIAKNDFVYNSQDIAHILMAFAEFGICNRQAIISIVMDQFWQNSQSNMQDYANIAYSLAVLDAPVDVVQRVVDDCVQKYETSRQEIPYYTQTQFRRAQLEYQSRGQRLFISREVMNMCVETYKHYLRERKMKNHQFVDVVYEYILQNGFSCQKKVLVQQGDIEINVLINGDDQNKVAVMVCGKECYACNDTKILLGRPKASLNLLINFGWELVSVSEPDWNTNIDYKKQIIQQISSRIKLE